MTDADKDFEQVIGVLQVGECVWWRDSWGSSSPALATVTGIELTKHPNMKHGIPVDAIHFDQPFIVSLANGKWAYSHQLEQYVCEHVPGGYSDNHNTLEA